MKFTSVRFRLALWNIGVLALVLFGFLMIVHVSVRSYLLSSMDRRLESMVERTASFIANPQTTPRIIPRREDRDRQDGRRRERMLRLFDLKGRMITRTGKPATTQDPPWDRTTLSHAASGKAVFSMVMEDDAPFRVYTRPVLRDGKRIAVIQAAISFSEVEVLLQNLTVTLTILVPVALIIAGFGGLFLTDRALKPVRQIVDAANLLNTDDLSRRLPTVGADEFAHLAKTINSLLSRLDETFTQLRLAIDRERRFTADASHELRTPLTAIKANTSLTLRGVRTPEQYRETLMQVDKSADTMSKLVQDLLLLARSDSKQLAMTFKAVDPRDLFSESAAMLSHGDADVPLSIQVADSSGMIWGDPEHLRRMVVNLLENALRHTPADGRVTLESVGKGNRVILTVTDTGEGIAPEHLPHVCERFYRVDAARAREDGGTGLGLAICKSIVDAHGGSMTVDSTLGQGTRVTIALPRIK